MKWLKIFPSLDEAKQKILPNQPRLLIVNEQRICLVNFNNEFFAVQDKCSHNGESLSKGKVNHLAEIICPWHNYRFSLKDGAAKDSSCPHLKTYQINADKSGFYISI